MSSFIDLSGQRFGELEVLVRAASRKGGTYWLCRCDCGVEKEIWAGNLRSGSRKSCGCSRTKHGMWTTPEYRAWQSMLNRCRNPNNQKQWKNYGGRGIEVKFTSFEEFFAEVGKRPSPKHSIDRINNDGHYEPGNVRWATKKQQTQNRRKGLKRCPRTHCKSGLHEFTPANTIWVHGHRKCKKCAYRAGKEWRASQAPDKQAHRIAYMREWRKRTKAITLCLSS